MSYVEGYAGGRDVSATTPTPEPGAAN